MNQYTLNFRNIHQEFHSSGTRPCLCNSLFIYLSSKRKESWDKEIFKRLKFTIEDVENKLSLQVLRIINDPTYKLCCKKGLSM